LVCLCLMSCVPNVASFSGLFILNCPFHFLKRLFTCDDKCTFLVICFIVYHIFFFQAFRRKNEAMTPFIATSSQLNLGYIGRGYDIYNGNPLSDTQCCQFLWIVHS
jgi:hypothetical protein